MHSAAHSRLQNSFKHCICTTTMTNIWLVGLKPGMKLNPNCRTQLSVDFNLKALSYTISIFTHLKLCLATEAIGD